jgi:hypothetical protein
MAKNSTVTVELPVRTDMKSVVKFEAKAEEAANLPITNVYIKKTLPGINEAKSVKVTVEVG